MRVLITAGPTREPMDPVRYLTNASSGAMGFAVAEAFQKKKFHVTVICGPTAHQPPSGIHLISVTTAREMHRQVQRRLPASDLFIATAAVCDFRFEKIHSRKMKKGLRNAWTVRLVRNPDNLLEAGRWKKRSRHPIRLVGFALETNRIPQAMAAKMREKNLDLIIGNTPASFSGPSITPLWLEKGQKIKRLRRMTKLKLGEMIARWSDGK